jgi:hypothetical protein
MNLRKYVERLKDSSLYVFGGIVGSTSQLIPYTSLITILPHEISHYLAATSIGCNSHIELQPSKIDGRTISICYDDFNGMKDAFITAMGPASNLALGTIYGYIGKRMSKKSYLLKGIFDSLSLTNLIFPLASYSLKYIENKNTDLSSLDNINPYGKFIVTGMILIGLALSYINAKQTIRDLVELNENKTTQKQRLYSIKNSNENKKIKYKFNALLRKLYQVF